MPTVVTDDGDVYIDGLWWGYIEHGMDFRGEWWHDASVYWRPRRSNEDDEVEVKASAAFKTEAAALAWMTWAVS